MNLNRTLSRLALCAALPIVLSGCMASFGTSRPEPLPPSGPVNAPLVSGVFSCGKTWASCVPVAGANIAVTMKQRERPSVPTLVAVCNPSDWKLVRNPVTDKDEWVCVPPETSTAPK